ncbi:MAG: hypothetical protein VKO21_09675 [Candidatus Sericytochromatia bacterium]|nr:hypothetical protein [Candidatus Sericytochromatia bacterium]
MGDAWMWLGWGLTAIVALAVVVLLVPAFRLRLSTWIGPRLAASYQKQLGKQFKAAYPELHARFSWLQPDAASQDQLQAVFRQMPPTEAQRLIGEFQRLAQNLEQRNPELAPFISAMKSQDAQKQTSALQALMKLKPDRRTALGKDVLWAYDQLNGRFPRWVKLIESRLKGAA